MIDLEDLIPVLTQSWFVEDQAKLERNILLSRLGLTMEELGVRERNRLARFSQAVMAGVSIWPDNADDRSRKLCQAAADIEASFAANAADRESARLSLFKAMLLYELAGLPGASATYADRSDLDERTRSFFTRARGTMWGALVGPEEAPTNKIYSKGGGLISLFSQAFGEIAQEFGFQLQGGDSAADIERLLRSLGDLAASYTLPVTGDDMHAFSTLIRRRMESSTLSVISKASSVSIASARSLKLPLELWPAQHSAIKSGLLDDSFQSFGFAAPTGTGKTALTRLVIADAISKNDGKKVLYICPSRALVRQVADDLKLSLSGVDIKVVEVGAHLTVHDEMPVSPEDADVLVFTPERADLLLRVNPEFLNETCLVVVDEAHHIEQAGRGVLLEFYLWRLRSILPNSARVVQLSAVTPNIAELTDWLGEPNRTKSLMVDWRSSRLRVGLLERGARGTAILQFEGGAPYTLLGDNKLPQDVYEGIAALAERLSGQGIVLVLCTSTKAAEKIAAKIATNRSAEQDVSDEVSTRLDAWIERELYPECQLRNLYKKRVIYHHAKIPPRVRYGLEEVIRSRKVDIICATTTLAEGVNFPFSTVIVESLVGRNYQISPRSLWNIAGRAGRFGVDTEGHCIIFRPEKWKDKLKDYKLEDYLKTKLMEIPAVESALASGILNLQKLVEAGKISIPSLDSVSLANVKIDNKATQEAKNVRSLLNIMRVGYAHASSSGLVDIQKNDDLGLEIGLLASSQLPASAKEFAGNIARQQRSVVRKATNENIELVQIAARVGWSLEAQRNIYGWLKTCQNWQIEQFGNIVVGGTIRDFSKLGFVIGPLAKNLLAFEGEALGGFTSFIAQKWIEGIPLSNMQGKHEADFSALVSTVYGRIQYLLPWGLFGLNELIEYEAKIRNIHVNSGLKDLSVLSAEGVPNFDALQLVMTYGLERVDAARLSVGYKRKRRDSDISSWFRTTPWAEIERTVRGSDNRRVDPGLLALHLGRVVGVNEA